MSAPINKLIEGAAAGRGECPLGPETDSCLVHVGDVGEQLAILATADDPRHAVYNSGGDFSTIGELAGWISELRPDAEVRLGPPDVRLPHVSRVDGSRLIEEFGFRPRSFRTWAQEALSVPQGMRSS
jgi:nucleoside-diphosphate-sugar epimerase